MSEQTANQEIPVFRMQKMYIKDFVREPQRAQGLPDPQPGSQGGLQPAAEEAKLDDEHSEVSIAITAKVHDKNNNDSVMFIIEIEHAAVFLMKHIPAEHHERVLAVDCPLMLFPFTRQIVCQAAVDGGFMPFLMEPINFIALYDNAQQKEQEN